MAHEVYRKIIALIQEATDLAATVGILNLLQPGLVKEMIFADILGHTLITTKRHSDACDQDSELSNSDSPTVAGR